MFKLIVGKKGTGKTKQLISLVNEAIEKSSGKVVCIEKGAKLTYDVHHGAKLLNTDNYDISGCDAFYGFLKGIAAGDYDVKDVFVDSITKICGDDFAKIGGLIEKAAALAEKENLNITATISATADELPESAKKYIAE